MKNKFKLVLMLAAAVTVVFCCFAFVGCGYCQHKLKELPKEPSTCTTAGLRTAYECEKCGTTFGYSDEKGLYKIREREPAPLGKHTVSAKNELVARDGAKGFADYDVYSECAECGEKFVVDREGLIPFTPSDNNETATAKHVRDGSFSATEITFAAGTPSGAVHIIQPLKDSGSDSLADVNVPFVAGESRYLVVALFNTSGISVPITYGAECYGERCVSKEISVPAGGFASACVDLNFTRTQPRSYHELTLKANITVPVTLRVLGYYYTSDKVQSVNLTAKGRTEYTLGEKLDTDGIVLTATYGNSVTRILSPDEYTVSLAGKELTADDTKVVIKYKKNTFTYSINVLNYRRGQNYAFGKTATASEPSFMPSRFGLGNLTDDLFDNYNAWGSSAHDSATDEVWVQVDLESAILIDNVVLYARHDGCYFPLAYRVEVSEDGENFTSVFEESRDAQAASFGTTPRNIRFDAVRARYVRIVGVEMTNSTGGPYYMEFAEIQVYKTTEA